MIFRVTRTTNSRYVCTSHACVYFMCKYEHHMQSHAVVYMCQYVLTLIQTAIVLLYTPPTTRTPRHTREYSLNNSPTPPPPLQRHLSTGRAAELATRPPVGGCARHRAHVAGEGAQAKGILQAGARHRGLQQTGCLRGVRTHSRQGRQRIHAYATVYYYYMLL
jgi:hypothetical protein